MNRPYDPSAIASDVARDRRQYWMRRACALLIAMFQLNKGGALATEFVQALQPVHRIPTRHGPILCRGGHGRLRWRALTFHQEEPQTIAWLDRLSPEDVLWDVGANVGLYSIYAARFRQCRVVSFEPEPQNLALLLDNVVLNDVASLCSPCAMALTAESGLGHLDIRYITKSGAYNSFNGTRRESAAPAIMRDRRDAAVRCALWGSSVDDLLDSGYFPAPTHLKIDVDGLEPDIIGSASKLLRHPSLSSVLIEVNLGLERDRKLPEIIQSYGFRLVEKRSNWESRTNRDREAEFSTFNLIFTREASAHPVASAERRQDALSQPAL